MSVAFVDRGVETAQQHLEWEAVHQQYTDAEYDEKQRIDSHAKEVPPPGQRGYPDVYVNGEDVTVTVDPYKNKHWIRDDSHAWRSKATAHRGAIKDHRGVVHTQHLIDRHPPPNTAFVPTSDHLNAAYKFSSRCVANSTRGYGNRVAAGTLPIHSRLIWEDRLPHRPDFAVWDDAWLENTHASRNRAFDCDGMCR